MTMIRNTIIMIIAIIISIYAITVIELNNDEVLTDIDNSAIQDSGNYILNNYNHESNNYHKDMDNKEELIVEEEESITTEEIDINESLRSFQ
ncbi:16092_t:CDS:2 [Funneliformis mosseae]|uniref:16092_t:CDS:1 n=1 Tax=Funneliformis mosseae TaxID=27381 RepID=A0A9N9EG20_FUNMO|nr:16092_t:CDS:2 [Funneliformis mosseae]